MAARPVTAATLAAAEDAFQAAHRHAYDYTPGSTETEIVTLRARAIGTVASSALDGAAPARAAGAAGRRDVWVDGRRETYAVLERDALGPGSAVGPRTIVEQEDSTLIVPDGWRGDIGAADILVLTREDA
jgi:N-methylhydantoinase A